MVMVIMLGHYGRLDLVVLPCAGLPVVLQGLAFDPGRQFQTQVARHGQGVGFVETAQPEQFVMNARASLMEIPMGPVTGRLALWVRNLGDLHNLQYGSNFGLYVPGTFSKDGLKLIRELVAPEDLIPVSEEDAGALAANSVAMGTDLVFGHCGEALASELARRGYTVHTVPLGSFGLILGQVLRMHVRDEAVLDAARQHIDTEKLDLIGRMEGGWYTRTTARFEMPAIPLDDWNNRQQ